VQAVAPVLLLAAVQGLLFALGYALLSRGEATRERGLASVRHLAIPFGPFLSLAAIQWLLLHRLALGWLQRWAG
jgi:prepilin signal peptidase PulO-like enzyme (type II secretory pathway)